MQASETIKPVQYEPCLENCIAVDQLLRRGSGEAMLVGCDRDFVLQSLDNEVAENIDAGDPRAALVLAMFNEASGIEADYWKASPRDADKRRTVDGIVHRIRGLIETYASESPIPQSFRTYRDGWAGVADCWDFARFTTARDAGVC